MNLPSIQIKQNFLRKTTIYARCRYRMECSNWPRNVNHHARKTISFFKYSEKPRSYFVDITSLNHTRLIKRVTKYIVHGISPERVFIEFTKEMQCDIVKQTV